MTVKSHRNLASRIQEAAGTLSERELALVDALSSKPDTAAFESLRSFADMAGVSPSTLSRLVARLGYESYRDLQLELRSTVTRLVPSPSERARLEGDKGDVGALFAQGLDDDIHQLRQLSELVSSDTFMEAIKLIAEAKGTVFVIGNGWSRSFADMLAHRLALCRPRVESSSSLDVLGLGKIADCGPGDCAVAIATRRYTRLTVSLAHALAERGVPLISITDSAASPLLRGSRHALVVPNMRSGAFDSPTPITAVIHLLCVGVSRLTHASMTRRFKTLDTISEEMGTFVTPDAGRRK